MVSLQVVWIIPEVHQGYCSSSCQRISQARPGLLRGNLHAGKGLALPSRPHTQARSNEETWYDRQKGR